MRGDKAIGYTPAGSGGSRAGLLLGIGISALIVVGLLVIAFLVGRWTAGADRSAPTGDMALRDGIPVPSRHSVAGAATAATNYQMASIRVNAGTLDGNQAQEMLLSDNASDTAKRALEPSRAPKESLNQERKSYSASSIVMDSYDGSRAVVRVWGSLATSSRVVPDPAGSVLWSTTVVTLDWVEEQWRVVDQQSHDGPWPARSGERFGKSEGEFSFRYDEVVGGAWAYVPEE